MVKDRFFNKKSEKLTEEELLQGRLFDEIKANHKDEDIPAVKVRSHRRKKGGERKFPESLPNLSVIIKATENHRLNTDRMVQKYKFMHYYLQKFVF